MFDRWTLLSFMGGSLFGYVCAETIKSWWSLPLALLLSLAWAVFIVYARHRYFSTPA